MICLCENQCVLGRMFASMYAPLEGEIRGCDKVREER